MTLEVMRISLLEHGIALGSVDTLRHNAADSGINILVAIRQVNPRVLDTLSRQQGVRYLRHALAADGPHRARRLAQRHLAGGIGRQGARAQVDADEGGALAGDVVEELVGGELGLVVLGENALVDLADVVVPVTPRPPGGRLAAGADVGNEEELGDGGEGGGGIDEVGCCVAVDLEGLEYLGK